MWERLIQKVKKSLRKDDEVWLEWKKNLLIEKKISEKFYTINIVRQSCMLNPTPF